MVVIVNALPAVDKTEFVYSVNGLHASGTAGQALYRCWTDVGQKPGEQKNRPFCTSGPVDMQDLFHSRADFVCQRDVCRLRTLFGLRRWHHVLPVDKRQSSSACIRSGCDGARFLFFCRQKSVCVMPAFAVDRCRPSCPSLVNLERKKG